MLHLATPSTSVVLDVRWGLPFIVHWGGRIDDAEAQRLVNDVSQPPRAGVIDRPALATIVPLHGDGWLGHPGLLGRHRGGSDWAPRFQTAHVECQRGTAGASSATVTAIDAHAELSLVTNIELAAIGLFSVTVELRNDSQMKYLLDELSVTLPLPASATHLTTFHGRWCGEFQTQSFEWPLGAWVAENRTGRTSHEQPPFVLAHESNMGAHDGQCWAAHLAWSGNHVIRAERQVYNRRYLQVGELLNPGEVCLEPGDVYVTPTVMAVYSSSGVQNVARTFQSHARGIVGTLSPRPVTLNTWEAMYFDHSPSKVLELADVAASVGVERFVLDDGWFNGRRDDSAGLGDWYVDTNVYPDGLGPIAKAVTEKGMQFGLWFEPEMVNPDSDVYREHPEWVLERTGYDHVLGRRQLVLDLTRTDAYSYVLSRLDTLLSELPIAYVKWDMNRPHIAAADESGTAATHRQTMALYSLLDDVRRLHPNVEIESCSSGGGRMDFEVLRRVERFWTSDTNDPVRRQVIQHHASLFFPPEVLGCHIGAPVAHTTSRESSLSMRCATAFFAHMGIEWNIVDATASERTDVAHVVAEHKALRHMLHRGEVLLTDSMRDTRAARLVHGVVSQDKRTTVLSFAQLDDYSADSTVRLFGLDANLVYTARRIIVASDDPTIENEYEWLRSLSQSGKSWATDGAKFPTLPIESTVLVVLEGS
ncbi:MAG: alpha-galactosidase [Actinomycetota bacterium]